MTNHRVPSRSTCFDTNLKIPWYMYIFITESCINWLSGEGGELMTDGDNSTCAPVNHATPDGAVLQYSYSVKSKCIDNDNFRLKVTMDSIEPCWYLGAVFFTERATETCNTKESYLLRPCTAIESQDVHNKSICTLSCKCVNSSDQCFLQVYSGMRPDIPEFKECDL